MNKYVGAVVRGTGVVMHNYIYVYIYVHICVCLYVYLD